MRPRIRTPWPDQPIIGNDRVLGVICARGGSKGLPRKNVLDLGGKPLIAWSVEAARGSALLDRTIVSTDDAEIAEAARAAGGDVPFLRPAELASDTAPIADALVHALEEVSGVYDIVVLLQATSPLRTAADIDATIKALADADADSAVTVSQQVKSPDMFVTIDGDGMLAAQAEGGLFKRRQEQVAYYLPNGQVYAVRRDYLIATRKVYSDRTRAVVTPTERSVDIDTDFDLKLARTLIAG